MACVIQMQRRSIEELRPVNGARLVNGFLARTLRSVTRNTPVQFALDENYPLYFLGVSEGIGTCSDIGGLNVNVLSPRPPGKHLGATELQKVIRSEYTVLRSEGKGVERKLELLEPVGINISTDRLVVILKKTGKTSSYVQLV